MATTPDPIQAQATPSVPEDRSRFIRTMAKDMAALAGAQTQPARPQAPKQDDGVAGVTLPKEETPFFERTRPAREDRPQEAVALPSMTEAAAIVTPSQTEDRNAILERLRKKVGESAQMSITQSPAAIPAPAPEAPKEKSWPDIPPPPAQFTEPKPEPAWQNVPAPTPEFAPLKEPTPSRLPPLVKQATADTYREPVEEIAPARPVPPPATPDRLHTFSSDFSKTIDQKGASTFSVLAAEQDSRPAPAPVLATPKKRGVPKALVAVVTGILLIALATGGIFATYRFVMTMKDTPIAAITVPSIVLADEYREISGAGNALLFALSGMANDALVPGNVLVTYLNTERTDDSGVVSSGPAGGATFLRTAQVPAPDILLRNITDESTVGIISAGGKNTPFFALRVDSYERTYAGMLTWEPLMARDLAALYPLYAAPAPMPAATSTATSTASTTVPAREPQQGIALTRFSDAIVDNHDVRVLKDTLGKTLMIYGYADKRTLLIARDEAAFSALLSRLKTD